MLIHVVLVLIALGILLYLANTYIPMAEPIKRIMNIVVIVAVVIWLLELSGILAYLDIPFPRVTR